MNFIANVGAHNAAWLADLYPLLGRSEVTDLGDGRVELTDDAVETLADQPDHHDGHVADGMIWIEGDGYVLTEQR
jgi:hypothetical protein